MKLALIFYGSLNTRSGGYLYDRKLVEYLNQQGDVVELISLPWRSYAQHLLDNFSGELHTRLEKLDVDFLLQDELNHPSLFRLNQSLRNCPPLISIVHHLRCSEAGWPALQRRLYAWVERRYLRSLDGYIFNSQTTRQSVQALLGDQRLQDGKFLVALPAGDQFSLDFTDQEIIERAHQPGPLRLVFLGNLIPRKGLHILLKALTRLPANSVELKVIGNLAVDSSYTRKIERQIKAEGLGERVRLLGSLENEQVAAELRKAQVLVVPSTYEGYGIAYLEGMSCGLPAIGTTSGAAHEIITHRQDGFLVRANDPISLGEAIAQVSDDRQLLILMSLAARRRSAAQPTWEQTGQRIRRFLETL